MKLNCKYKGNSEFQNGVEYQIVMTMDRDGKVRIRAEHRSLIYDIALLLSEWGILEVIPADVFWWFIDREQYIKDLEKRSSCAIVEDESWVIW